DGFADAPAGGAGLLHLEEAAARDDLPHASAGRAGPHLGAAALRAAGGAGLAGNQSFDLQLLLDARGGLLEADLEVVAQIGAALASLGPRGAAAAAEEFLEDAAAPAAAEHLAEDVEGIDAAPAGRGPGAV